MLEIKLYPLHPCFYYNIYKSPINISLKLTKFIAFIYFSERILEYT